MENIELLITENEIIYQSKKQSQRIEKDYNEEPPIFLVVLGGSIFFTNYIIPTTIPCEIDYIRLNSYEGLERKELKLIYEPILDLQDRDIIIIEDIIDSGTTIEYLHDYLKSKNVRSVKVASMLYKELSKHLVDYGAIQIKEDDFVVGFGLDYKGLFRNYKNIYKVIDV